MSDTPRDMVEALIEKLESNSCTKGTEGVAAIVLRALLSERDDKTTGWQPIETAPKDGSTMFVAVAFGVNPNYDGVKGSYNSDPYCVWRHSDGGYSRWPHTFSPTHWMTLPEAPQ